MNAIFQEQIVDALTIRYMVMIYAYMSDKNAVEYEEADGLPRKIDHEFMKMIEDSVNPENVDDFRRTIVGFIGNCQLKNQDWANLPSVQEAIKKLLPA